jgi:hypothetical protein
MQTLQHVSATDNPGHIITVMGIDQRRKAQRTLYFSIYSARVIYTKSLNALKMNMHGIHVR